MKRSSRFSIAMLCLVPVYVALGLHALRVSDETWTSIVVSVTLLILMTTTLQMIVVTGRPRRFWQGFVLFGWILFATMFFPSSSGGGLGMLLTSSYLLNTISAEVFPSLSQPAMAPVVQYVGGRMRPLSPRHHSFLLIGHCYVTFLMAALGGLLGLALADQAENAPSKNRAN
jgi:hypothetical protein